MTSGEDTTEHPALAESDYAKIEERLMAWASSGESLEKSDLFALMYGVTPMDSPKDVERSFALWPLLQDYQKPYYEAVMKGTMTASKPLMTADTAARRDKTVILDFETCGARPNKVVIDEAGYDYSGIRWYAGMALGTDGSVSHYASRDGGLTLDLNRRYCPLPIPEPLATDEDEDNRRSRRARGRMTGNDRRKESAEAKQAMRDRCLAKLKNNIMQN